MNAMKDVYLIKEFIEKAYHIEPRIFEREKAAVFRCSCTLPVVLKGKTLASFEVSILARDTFIDAIFYIESGIEEKKCRDTGEYLQRVNYIMDNGSFDFNIEKGEVLYRQSTYTEGIQPSEGILEHLIETSLFCACQYHVPLQKLLAGELNVAEAFELGANGNLEDDIV